MSGEPSHATQLRNHWWWRPGWSAERRFYTWHLTFDGQDQLHQLVSAYQGALSRVPGLDLIPLEQLHLTMQGVGFTDKISADEARAIADAAAVRVVTLPPAELTFHRPTIRPEAIALQPFPGELLAIIRDTIREGIADVWGKDAVPETDIQFEPHLSLAYVNTNGSAAAAFRALSSIDPVPAHVTVTHASLIVLRRDHHSYRWQTFARAPFRGRTNS